jgi:hypothetical protein
MCALGREITPQLRAEVLARAGRRCECQSGNCRHHRKGGRCPRGLRGDQWKIYYRTSRAGLIRWNLEAWCLTCFDNNFDPKVVGR